MITDDQKIIDDNPLQHDITTERTVSNDKNVGNIECSICLDNVGKIDSY
jgi:hypothetical protein